MNILFVHWVFPSQFGPLATALQARGHDVRAIMDRANPIPEGFNVTAYDAPANDGSGAKFGWHINPHLARAEIVAAKAEGLAAAGFVPDLVIGHFGLGETIFLKDVFPLAKLIVYSDVFFNHDEMSFDPEFRADTQINRMQATALSASLLMSMNQADLLWTPTQWQASSLPKSFHHKLRTIFDGVDTDRCRPNPAAGVSILNKGVVLKAGDEVLTFAARNLEPLRGYHKFMRALPQIMRERPAAHVIIVGGHGVSYGDPPAGGGTWKSTFLREVQAELDPGRVHILGSVPYERFLEIVQISRAHVYITQPYVLSWSVFEAMACGALMVGSRTPPVEELIVEGQNGLLAGYFDQDELVGKVVEALAFPDRHLRMRDAARQLIVSRYDTLTVCLPEQLGMCDEVTG